ncbi:MAG TPA: 30S ribosomal protein S6 [Kaistia sp.]|nr:30S ribosomal protein S6 [Kaistia sp.]
MPLYEHVFLSRQDVSAQQVETLTETFKGILEANGGSVAKIEQWGLKSVAFRIRKNRKAHYTLLNIDAPAAAVAELERQQRINEDVLRVLTIRVDALEEGQSAMLQKRDRDDRDGDRGGRFGDRGDRPRSFGGGGGFRGDREGGAGGGGFRGERRPRSEETEGGAE